MKTIKIISAKIRPEIYRLIKQGRKLYEVRDESFQHADVIRYVDADTGEQLGMYWLGTEDNFDRSHDPFIFQLSGVDSRTFNELFPKTIDRLYVAPIWSRIRLDEFPVEDAEHDGGFRHLQRVEAG